MKTYHLPVRTQRGWMFQCMFWSFFICVQAVLMIYNLDEDKYKLLTGIGVLLCLVSVVTMPLSVLSFFTSFQVDEDGFTQYTPCFSPLKVEWHEIESLHLKLYGLRIKVKGRSKPLRLSIYLDDFKELWKVIEEKSGKRVQ